MYNSLWDLLQDLRRKNPEMKFRIDKGMIWTSDGGIIDPKHVPLSSKVLVHPNVAKWYRLN